MTYGGKKNIENPKPDKPEPKKLFENNLVIEIIRPDSFLEVGHAIVHRAAQR
jgi:hypothetical protein